MSRLIWLAAAALLAGCAPQADEPATLPPVTSVPTATPTPTPDVATPAVTAPVEPDNAHDYSAEGVEAFTRYAIDVINYAYQTNDVSYLEQIMTPDCQTCANVTSAIDDHVAIGGHVDGGQMVIHCLLTDEPAPGLTPGSVVDVTVTASTTYDGDGNAIASEDDRLGRLVVSLDREMDTWSLDAIQFGVGEPTQDCA